MSNTDENKNSKKERITYENEYDHHIMDLKLKIMYNFLIDADVLDVGCGETEGVYRRVGRVMKKYVGIDKDLKKDECISTENKEYRSCYMSEFSSDERFDVIILFGTIEEVPDTKQHLIQAKSLLKSKGNIFISIPNPFALNRIMGACNGYLESPESLDIHDMKQGHLRLPTIEQLQEIVKDAGLKVIKTWPIGFKPIPMGDMPKLKKYWHQFDNMMKIGKKYGITKFCAGWLLQASI